MGLLTTALRPARTALRWRALSLLIGASSSAVGACSAGSGGGDEGGESSAGSGASTNSGGAGSAYGGSVSSGAAGSPSMAGGSAAGMKGSVAGSSGGAPPGTNAGSGPTPDGGRSSSGGSSGMPTSGGGSVNGGSSGMPSGGGGSAGRGGSAGANGNAGGNASGGPCTTVGSTTTVNATIVVPSEEPFDGGCRRFVAGPALGDGSQAEGQQPVFEIENGGSLRNVVLGAPAADGIHVLGDASLRNVVWEDIGEDALTIVRSGTVTLDGGSARDGEDKVFQINAASTFRLSNFRATNAGKLIRQNGGTTFTVHVFIDRSDISNMDEAIFRTDSSSSTVSMTNTRYSRIGDALFIGVSSGNITQSGNTEY